MISLLFLMVAAVIIIIHLSGWQLLKRLGCAAAGRHKRARAGARARARHGGTPPRWPAARPSVTRAAAAPVRLPAAPSARCPVAAAPAQPPRLCGWLLDVAAAHTRARGPRPDPALLACRAATR